MTKKAKSVVSAGGLLFLVAMLTGCPASGSRLPAGVGEETSVSGSSSATNPAKSAKDVASTFKTLGDTDTDLYRLRALAQALFYGCNRDKKVLEGWLEQPESALIPLLPVNDAGVPAVFASSDCCAGTMHMLSCKTSESLGARLYYTTPEGRDIHCRVGDFGVPPAPARTRQLAQSQGPVVIDHLKTLPASAHLIHGIAWAFAELPDLAQTQAGSLRDELNLVIPEQTVNALQTGYGTPSLYKSTAGDLCLVFEHAGLDYFVLVERYHFKISEGKRVRLTGIPEHSHGIIKSVSLLGSADPHAVLTARALDGGPTASTWSLVSEGWTNL